MGDPTFRLRGLFLESPENVSGPEVCFVFVMFLFTVKVSIILIKERLSSTRGYVV